MKWSRLPKEYKDLIDNLSHEEKLFIELTDDEPLTEKFLWFRTKQKDVFWRKCHNANSIINLPPIPK